VEEEAMPTVAERVADAVAPVLADLGLVLHDVEHAGTSIRVVVDAADPTAGGLDVDSLTAATKAVSRLMDELDPLDGAYTLEVSSPGLERPLRTPAHFQRAIGSEVSLKTVAGTEGDRRLAGVITAADDATVTLAFADGSSRSIRLEEIERARTTFAWGGAPKPGSVPKGKPGSAPHGKNTSPSGKQATSR
jgi:ribosome maturation factor RimP